MEHDDPVCLNDCPQEKCPCECHERAWVNIDAAFGCEATDA
jgi:hypothetical protein